jgi:hypothetical protein
MMNIKQWTLVPIAGGGISTQAYLWCNHNIPLMDWDHNFEGFMFKHEKDAIMFALKWG